MPYVRDRHFSVADNLGDLAYKLSEVITQYGDERTRNFVFYAGVVGVLESLKLEYYRSRVGPYEEKKKVENGDVGW